MSSLKNDFLSYGSNLLIKLVVFCFIAVFAIQILFFYKPFSFTLSLAEKIEGEKIEIDYSSIASEMDLKAKYIVLKVVNPYVHSLPEGKIYINNKLIGDFSKLNKTLDIQPGDRVSLDFSAYSMEIFLNIVPSEEINTPEEIVAINGTYSFVIPK
ncbi:MAG: hypothetical protein ACOYVD_05100 [Bacillota bacterium]